jgi:hypothetical protein
VRKLTRSASGASPSKLKAKIQGYIRQKKKYISINNIKHKRRKKNGKNAWDNIINVESIYNW